MPLAPKLANILQRLSLRLQTDYFLTSAFCMGIALQESLSIAFDPKGWLRPANVSAGMAMYSMYRFNFRAALSHLPR